MKINHKENFILKTIRRDIERYKKISVRFPPEPNGFLHIGHAKSILLNFEIPKIFGIGSCFLRFDDTNPDNEEIEYIKSIKEDIRWLGYLDEKNVLYTSDHFPSLYKLAIHLIRNNQAYVCNLTHEQISKFRGDFKQRGTNSPCRERSIKENLYLFQEMKNGSFEEGDFTLRAKINMDSKNINMRDPIIYRIKKKSHPRTQNKWCIYPMYDYAHALSDAIEGITHSLCTLEFENNQPLYNWFVKNCGYHVNPPKQIEFSRLFLSHTVTSKRKLKYLVENKIVDSWDDPRMPTLRGLRRRGITPLSIKNFCRNIGISKQDSITNISLLENIVRKDLDGTAARKNVVLDPLKVVISNIKSENILVPNHPKNRDMGFRQISISNTIYIEKSDFLKHKKSGLRNLSLEGSVKLLNSHVIKCHDYVEDEHGNIIKLYCSIITEESTNYDAIIHWVDAKNCKTSEVRRYGRLFKSQIPEKLLEELDPSSLKIYKNTKIESSLTQKINVKDRFQFNRVGYFLRDPIEYRKDNKNVFNEIVALKNRRI